MTAILGDIKNGPSQLDFFLGLIDRKKVRPRAVTFVVGTDSGAREQVVITGLDAKDESGENWNFRGYILGGRKGRRCQGDYRTDTRTGTIEYLE